MLPFLSSETNPSHHRGRRQSHRNNGGGFAFEREFPDLRVDPTPGSEGPVIPPLPEDTSFLGLVRTENAVPQSEPSPASTWGTIPTPRVSNNSSMMDLGLRGLPEATLGSEPSANSSLGDLGLTNLPPLGVPSGNSSMSDFGLPSLSLDTLSLNSTNPRAGVADEQPSSGESIRSNLSSSNSHRRPRESHVTYGHPVDSRENPSTRQPNVNDNNVISSRATSRNSHFSELDQSGRRSRESSRSSSGTSSQLSSRNESLTDLVFRPSRGSRHGSSHDSASERGSEGSSESVNSADMGMSSSSQNMRAIPGSSFVRPTNGQESRERSKQQRRRVSFGPVTHEIVNVYPRHDEHVEDPSELMTPKGKPMSYSHSKSSRHYHHRHSTSSGEGLGLSLPLSTSSASSRQGINNESDLNLVDQSLMQLVEGESREHRHHRHSRHTSGADSLDQHPSQLVGSRTGYVIYGSGPPSAHGSQGSPSTEPSTLPSTERKAPVPLERRSASDTQQPRQEERFIMHGHGNSRDDTIRPRRRPSTSTATLSSIGSSAHGNRHSAHVHSSASSTENHHHHHNNQHPTDDASDLSRRSSNKRHRQTPGPEMVLPPSSSEYPPAVGGSGLLLSFTPAPPGPSTSAATTADGEPSSIYAPRPVNSRHTSNLFGLWNARSDR
ncbi:hypothetical protein NLI96_g3605 [Meripilus lineatus]|uniref:Uncharacterized protein n=1 Tax=Meripilus lineatus TaxID=2056292 RepID=A0AAD5YIY0_9APHY|nr:hypothetical protein NLI96_g3605 [Physisporinus lineatus]